MVDSLSNISKGAAPTLTSASSVTGTGTIRVTPCNPNGSIKSEVPISEKEYAATLCKLEDAYRKIEELKDVIVELNIQLVRFKKQSEGQE